MLGTAVTRLTRDTKRDRFLLETTEGPMAAERSS